MAGINPAMTEVEMKLVWIAGAFAGGLMIGGAGMALAQAQVSRSILSTIAVAGTDREARMGIATFPEGSAIARHYHPGEELSVVVEGEVLLKVEGQSDRLMKPGDSYAVPRGILHSAAPPEGKTGRVVVVWIIDKGQPLAVPS
jgi:quercetin dioxygenase-like cupin family protein